jgi:tetratricopeptide (TPR) repeat protein
MFRRPSSSLPNPWRRLLTLSSLLLASPSEKVRRAHALLDAGKYAEAAHLFGQLADLAVARKHPDRAGSLALQAAQLYLHCSDYAQATKRLQQGLRLLISNGHQWRASQILEALLAVLRDQQQYDAAATLQHEFAPLLNLAPPPLTPLNLKPRGHLPSQCPNCGGVLDKAQLQWLDAFSVECASCGAVVKAE